MNLPYKILPRIAGPAAFLVILIFVHPEGLSPAANAVLAVTVWMAIWWVSEAIPIAATALLPIVLFPMTGALDLKVTTAQYGHRYIFLYIGGFSAGDRDREMGAAQAHRFEYHPADRDKRHQHHSRLHGGDGWLVDVDF